HCEGEAIVHGDRLQLGILFANLVSNAIRYNRRAGRVDVTLATTSAPGRSPMAHVVVRDTGPGMDPTVADRMFDRFWRAAPSRSSREGGTGLGLAIGKAIVDAHGGTIGVESTTNGTTFTVRLPAAP